MSEDRWGQVLYGAMRSFVIVLLLPALDSGSGLRQTGKPMQIETHIAELPVEALQVTVLRRLARLDEVQGDAMRIRPRVQEMPRKLGAIVDGDLLWHAMGCDQLVEDADNSLAWQGRIDLNRQAFPRHGVEHVLRTETASVGERIQHEVHGPGLSPFLGFRSIEYSLPLTPVG
jgi:hypothetical protein